MQGSIRCKIEGVGGEIAEPDPNNSPRQQFDKNTKDLFLTFYVFCAHNNAKQEDAEAEMRRMKLELKQTKDLYNIACKEAFTAKQKVTELQKWRMNEENRSQTSISIVEEQSSTGKVDKLTQRQSATVEIIVEAAKRIARQHAQKKHATDVKLTRPSRMLMATSLLLLGVLVLTSFQGEAW